jgi:hypothetical protein
MSSDILVLKLDNDVSSESITFTDERYEQLANHSGTNVFVYYARVLVTGIRVMFQLRGILGLLIIPIDFILNIVMMILKLLFLNPPGCTRFQSTMTFEFAIPLKIDPATGPTSTFSARFLENYSLHTQCHLRKDVASKSYASPEQIWWEDIALGGWFRLPLFSTPYHTVDDYAVANVTRWCVHPLNGIIAFRLSEDEEKGDMIIVTGKFRIWSVLRPIYLWIMRATFQPYGNELKLYFGLK